jgi:hypothetical protein
MPLALYIDQTRTFNRIIFLGCEPKVAHGSSDKQDVTKAGIPKWEVQVVASYENFGKIESEVLKVSVLSMSDPGSVISEPGLVQLIGLRARINPVERRVDRTGVERTIGGTVTYQADEVIPV